MKDDFFAEALGWYGAITILLAYALLIFKTVNIDNGFYIFFNITGSIGIAYVAFAKRDYQPAIVNFLWALIAVIGLIIMIAK